MNTNKRKKIGFAAVIAFSVSLALVITVGAAFLPEYKMSVDTTKYKNYTTSKESLDFLESLNEDITLYLIGADGTDVTVEYFFQRLANASDRINIEYIFLDNTAFLEKYGLSSSSSYKYAVVVESAKRNTVVFYDDMIVYSNPSLGLESISANQYFSYVEYYQAIYAANQTSEAASEIAKVLQSLIYETVPYFVGEKSIVAACEYVCLEVVPQILFTEGHGEPIEEGSAIEEAFGEANRINLSDFDEITLDRFSCLIINTPSKDITNEEKQKVLSYLRNGGRLLVITNDANLEMENLMSVLGAYGLSSRGGIVCEGEGDDKTSKFGALVNSNHDSMAAADSAEIVPYISNANPITMFTPSDGSLITSALLTSSANAYVDGVENSKGIQTVAAAAEEAVGAETARIAWFTGADSFNSSEYEAEQVQGNMYTLIYALAWLNRGYDSLAPDVEPRQHELGGLNIPKSAATVIILTVVVVLPVAVVLTCLVNRYKRKKRMK